VRPAATRIARERSLAAKIVTSRTALEGERKQVTALFADVKGSMDLTESIDPEEWHKVIDRLFRILADGVHRFEGPSTSIAETGSWVSGHRLLTRTMLRAHATQFFHSRTVCAATEM